MPRFSANLGFLWADLPLLERVAAAGRAGFKAVEFHWPYDTPAADLRAACADAGVRVLGINSPRGDVAAGEFGIAVLPGREAEFRDGLAATLDYGQAIGAAAIHVMAGVPGDLEPARAEAPLLENLRFASERAGTGMRLLLEALSPAACPGYAYSTIDGAARIRELIGGANVDLMFDTYHVGMVGADVTATFTRHLDAIGHVQIAGVPDRAEPDRGVFDVAGFLAAVEDSAYAGWIGLEYKPAGDTDAGLDWVGRAGYRL